MPTWSRRFLATSENRESRKLGDTSEHVLVQEQIDVPATAEELAALHGALDRFWTAVDQTLEQRPDELWRLQFATALAELGANIVRYAYLSQPTPGPMQLRLQAYSGRIEAHFTDFGTAFAAPPAPPRPKPFPDMDVASIPEGGYGLALIRAVVDQLDYTRTESGENHWRLVKRMQWPVK